MRFSRQEFWSGLPFPFLEDLPDPRVEHVSLASAALAGGFFSTSVTWEAQFIYVCVYIYIYAHQMGRLGFHL